MNSSEYNLPENSVTNDNEPVEGLYHGDTGCLPLETRRVLVQLLSGPSLDARRHSKLWPILMRDEVMVRSRLAELFLELVMDRDQKVAFTRQADTEDLETPLLLRRSPLTFINTALLLFLRQALVQADAQGERAVVSAYDMQEHLNLYEKTGSTDEAGFRKKVQASVEKMKKSSLLHKIRGSESRYEVSPTLKLLFSAAEIAGLMAQYRVMATAQNIHLAATPETSGEDEA